MVSAVAPWLAELLETVEEFGTASVELVAWELSLPEAALASARDHAIAHGLIEVVGRDSGITSRSRPYRNACNT